MNPTKRVNKNIKLVGIIRDFGLTPAVAGCYGFVVFLADSGRYHVLSLQSGRAIREVVFVTGVSILQGALQLMLLSQWLYSKIKTPPQKEKAQALRKPNPYQYP